MDITILEIIVMSTYQLFVQVSNLIATSRCILVSGYHAEMFIRRMHSLNV